MGVVISRWRAPAALALAVLAWPCAARAQRGVTQATLEGAVQDPGGTSIPGAEVTARNEERGQSWQAGTDGLGRFRFLALPPGRYTVFATLAGFTRGERRIELGLGQAASIRERPAHAGRNIGGMVTDRRP